VPPAGAALLTETQRKKGARGMTVRKRDGLVFLYCLLTAAVCLAICSKCSFLYPINDWTDANAYLSCGRGMLRGRVMYRDLYEHKGPLLYALHALCCLVQSGGFLGVFFLEILCAGLFLTAAYQTLALYGAKRAALLWVPVIAALVYASFSFREGDSAEELCLPMLAWSLYGMLAWLRRETPGRMAAGKLALNGLLCGCVLWVKFTLLGFYVPWIVGMMLWHAAKREWKDAFRSLGWFLAGVALATVPWAVYFGVNGALGPWLKTYLYDNLFLYGDGERLGLLTRAKAVLRALLDWFGLNWGYVAPMALGLLGITLLRGGKNAKRPPEKAWFPAVSGAEKAFLWATAGFLALGVYIGGKSYPYYGLILAAFAPLAALPMCLLAERALAPRRKLAAALAGILVLGAGLFSLAASRNTQDLLKPKTDTMQYRVAAIVAQTPDATLLNYGFLDAGFYTACDIAPTVRYFHRTNVPLQEMIDEQERYVDEGITDYVVTRGMDPASIDERYDLVATEKAPANFWYEYVYLYRRKDLAP
jgi:hypothetical protein